MTTSLLAPISKNERQRLQAELKNVPQLVKEWKSTAMALQEAERLVDSGDKSPRYLEKRQREYSAALGRLSATRGQIQQKLVNTCQDKSLWAKFNECHDFLGFARRDKERVKNSVNAALESLEIFKSELRRELGEGVEVEADQNLPWTGVMERVNGFVTGKEILKWTIRGESLQFKPGVLHATTIEHHQKHWVNLLRSIHSAKLPLRIAEERAEAAEADFAAAKQALIESPV